MPGAGILGLWWPRAALPVCPQTLGEAWSLLGLSSLQGPRKQHLCNARQTHVSRDVLFGVIVCYSPACRGALVSPMGRGSRAPIPCYTHLTNFSSPQNLTPLPQPLALACVQKAGSAPALRHPRSGPQRSRLHSQARPWHGPMLRPAWLPQSQKTTQTASARHPRASICERSP